MSKLAVVIPYAQEGANTFFTCRSVHENLQDIEHEIIVIDNMCPELMEQLNKKGEVPDRGHDHLNKKGEECKSHPSVIAKQSSWLKYLKYDLTLSHWRCKSFAIEQSDADYFMFIDAHCIPSNDALTGMYEHYLLNEEYYNGTIHLPLTYNILEDKRLTYSLQWQPEKGFIGYTFCAARETNDVTYEVPCMSSCGSLMSRKVYNKMYSAWAGLTSYSGGEHIMNYVLALQGHKHWIYNYGTLHHHGNERGYHWNWMGYQYNRATAMYLINGEEFMWKYLNNIGCSDKTLLMSIGSSVIENYCSTRKNCVNNQTITLEDYLERWKIDYSL